MSDTTTTHYVREALTAEDRAHLENGGELLLSSQTDGEDPEAILVCLTYEPDDDGGGSGFRITDTLE